MKSTYPVQPTDNETSWTIIGQDIELAGVYGNIIPVATSNKNMGWTFWFMKKPGQRPVNPGLMKMLLTAGNVIVVRYSSENNPLFYHFNNGPRIYLSNRAEFDKLVKRFGTAK
jgi:hypothetical protein